MEFPATIRISPREKTEYFFLKVRVLDFLLYKDIPGAGGTGGVGEIESQDCPPVFWKGRIWIFSIHIKNEGTRTFLEGFFLTPPPGGPNLCRLFPLSLSLSPQPPEVFQHQPTIQSTPRKKKSSSMYA